MSEQSPWGTPTPPSYGPPSGGTPSGPGGYPSGPPPAGPPGGYGYGGPGGPSGPFGPGGPGPRKSRTGLLVGLAVLGIVVVAGIAVTLVLVLRGGSGDTASNGDTPSTSTTSASPTTTSTTPTIDPTTPATPTTSAAPKLPPKDADTVSGDGYRFEDPSGWQKGSKSVLKTLGSGIDQVVLYGGPSIPLATANILVEREDTGGIADLRTVEPIWKRNLRSVAGKKLTPLKEITIDGERAVGVQVTRVNSADLTIHQVFYLTLHDGVSYTVGLSEETSQSAHDGDLKDVLTTWRWTT